MRECQGGRIPYKSTAYTLKFHILKISNWAYILSDLRNSMVEYTHGR